MSIVSTVTFWFVLSAYVEPEETTDEVKSGGEDESGSEHDLGSTDEPTDGSSSDAGLPKKSRKRKRRRARKIGSAGRVKKEDDEIKKEEEDIEESTRLAPLVGETEDDVEY